MKKEKIVAYSLSDLKTVRADKPPRIMIYGSEGVGKTTLASEFPDPVFLQVEEGTPADVELTSFGTIETFGDFIGAMEALHDEPHEFKTLVVDSATALQRLVFAETCARGDEHGNAKARIEDFGYGKGYVNAKGVQREALEGFEALRKNRGMSIVIIAHSIVTRFDDPESASYDRYEIDLHKHLLGDVTRDLDAILLLKKPVSVKEEKGGGFDAKRVRAGDTSQPVLIHSVGKPAFVAKNRFNIPDGLRFDRGKGFEVLAPFLPIAAPAAPETKKKAA
jgi:hypothetical protein